MKLAFDNVTGLVDENESGPCFLFSQAHGFIDSLFLREPFSARLFAAGFDDCPAFQPFIWCYMVDQRILHELNIVSWQGTFHKARA